MLLVKNTGQPGSANIRFDDYIPLAVNWVQVGSVRPIYYRIESPEGGDVELAIEPLRGELVGVTIIESPTRRVQVPGYVYESSRVTEGSVFVYLDLWDLNSDKVPTKRVVCEEGQLSWGEDENNLYFSWSDGEPERFVFAGNAGFGITESSILSSVIANKVNS